MELPRLAKMLRGGQIEMIKKSWPSVSVNAGAIAGSLGYDEVTNWLLMVQKRAWNQAELLEMAQATSDGKIH
jgi:hypothetical protein